jgi:hypothetical protein
MISFHSVIDSDPLLALRKINVEVDKIVSIQPFEPDRTEVKKPDVWRTR